MSDKKLIAGFTEVGKRMWASWSSEQKDEYIAREKFRMERGYLTKSQRDMLKFIIKAREEEIASLELIANKKPSARIRNFFRAIIAKIKEPFISNVSFKENGSVPSVQ